MTGRLAAYLFRIALCGVLLAGVGCAERREEPTIKIGTVSPLTGAGALYGKKLTQAVDLAFEEVNARGGVNGHKLIAIHEDSKLTARPGVSAIQKLISVDRVPVVIGAVASSVTLAIAPIAEENGIVLITPISSAVKISDAGDYVFRIAPSDALQARDAARWILGAGFSRVAVLYINNDYGVGLLQHFESEMRSMGGEIVAKEAFPQGATDVRSQLAKIKEANPGALFIPSYMDEAGRALRQAKELGLNVQIFGTDPFHDPNMLEGAGDAANGAWFMDVAAGSGPVYDAFAKKYREKYGMEADIIAAESYDAAIAIIKTMEKAKSSNPELIKDELYRVKFDGASGRIEFDKNGDVPTKSFQKFAIEDMHYVEWRR